MSLACAKSAYGQPSGRLPSKWWQKGKEQLAPIKRPIAPAGERQKSKIVPSEIYSRFPGLQRDSINDISVASTVSQEGNSLERGTPLTPNTPPQKNLLTTAPRSVVSPFGSVPYRRSYANANAATNSSTAPNPTMAPTSEAQGTRLPPIGAEAAASTGKAGAQAPTSPQPVMVYPTTQYPGSGVPTPGPAYYMVPANGFQPVYAATPPTAGYPAPTYPVAGYPVAGQPQMGMLPIGQYSAAIPQTATPSFGQHNGNASPNVITNQFAGQSPTWQGQRIAETTPQQSQQSAAQNSVAGNTPAAKLPTKQTPSNVANGRRTIEDYIEASHDLSRQGKMIEAAKQLAVGLRAYKHDRRLLLEFGRLKHRQGDIDGAVSQYETLLLVHRNDPVALNDLALCRLKQGNIEQAESRLLRAVELDPDNKRYRNNLAAILVTANKLDEAFTHLEHAHGGAIAHYNLGNLLHRTGNSPRAVEYLNIAVAMDPSLTPAIDLLKQIQHEATAALAANQQRLTVAKNEKWNPGSIKRQSAEGSSTTEATRPAAFQDQAEGIPDGSTRVAPIPSSTEEGFDILKDERAGPFGHVPIWKYDQAMKTHHGVHEWEMDKGSNPHAESKKPAPKHVVNDPEKDDPEKDEPEEVVLTVITDEPEPSSSD